MKVASFEEREWIDPWRDRRPMTTDPVLVTAETKDGRKVMFGWCERKKDMDIWHTSIEGRKVLAWQPIPECYKGDENDELPI